MSAVVVSTSTRSWEASERFTDRSAWARHRMLWWESALQRAYRVVPRVLDHRTSVVDAITKQDILALQARIAKDPALHALGDLNKGTDVAPSAKIKNGTTPFAVMHVFHFIIEEVGSLPSISELREHVLFEKLLVSDLELVVRESVDQDHVTEDVARKALDWRIGNFYYSLAKEQWTIALFREEGLDARQHVLADVLFGVDFWIEDINFSLYVGNKEFRDGRLGRKDRASDKLSDAAPEFDNLDINLPVEHEYGVIHLPNEGEVRRLARQVREHLQK